MLPDIETNIKRTFDPYSMLKVLQMSENELEWLANHLGHEQSVHHKFYRLQHHVVELAKVSRLLLTVEAGKAHVFKGKTMDEIDLNGKYK